MGILETTWKQILVPSNIAPDIDSSDGFFNRRDLTSPPLPQFLSDVLDEGPLLGIEEVLRQLWSFRHQKWNEAALLRVELLAPNLPNAERVEAILSPTLKPALAAGLSGETNATVNPAPSF